MSVDFLRWLKLPSSVQDAEPVTAYARNPEGFAEGYDERFRAAVHCAWLERMLPRDYPSYESRVFAPKWRGLFDDSGYCFGTENAPWRLFRMLGAQTIKAFCIPYALYDEDIHLKRWLSGGTEEDFDAPDVPNATGDSSGGPELHLPGASTGLEFLDDDAIDALGLWREQTTPFSYRPWAEEAEGVFPLMFRTIHGPDLGSWEEPAILLNPYDRWTTGSTYPYLFPTQDIVMGGAGTLSLHGTRTTYKGLFTNTPPYGGYCAVDGYGAFADLFDEILENGSTEESSLSSPTKFVCSPGVSSGGVRAFSISTDETYTTAYSSSSDPTFYSACFYADSGIYRFTPTPGVSDMIKSVKIGVWSWCAGDETHAGFAEDFAKESLLFSRKLEWRTMVKTGDAWEAASDTGLDAFRDLNESVLGEWAAWQATKTEYPNGDSGWYKTEYPCAIIIDWDFLAFPPAEESSGS